MRCRVVEGHVSGLSRTEVHHLVVEPVVAPLHGPECRANVYADAERLRAADEVHVAEVVALHVAGFWRHEVRGRDSALAEARDAGLLREDRERVCLLARHGKSGSRQERVEVWGQRVPANAGERAVALCAEKHGLCEPAGVLVYSLAHHVLYAIVPAEPRVVAFVRVFGAAVDVEELLGRSEHDLSRHTRHVLKAESTYDDVRV